MKFKGILKSEIRKRKLGAGEKVHVLASVTVLASTWNREVVVSDVLVPLHYNSFHYYRYFKY